MSPEDEMLSQVVLYIGLGIGALCLAAALFVQWRMCRAGKASRGDVVGLIGVIVGLVILTAYDIYWEPVGRGASVSKVTMPTLMIAFSVSVLWRICQFSAWTFTTGTGLSLRDIFCLVGAALAICLLFLLVGYALYMVPKPLWLQAVVLFVGALLGLLYVWPFRTARRGGTAPEEKQSPINRAGS